MSAVLIDWITGADGHTWYRGTGIKREEIKGPCLVRDDGTFMLLKKNKLRNFLGIPYVDGQIYEWGKFRLPGMIPDANGNLTPFLGEWTKTSNAQASNWNSCNYYSPIDERSSTTTTPPPPPPPLPTVPYTSNNRNIDWRVLLALAIVVIIVVYIAFNKY